MKYLPTIGIALAILVCTPLAQAQQKTTSKAQAAAANRAAKLPGAKPAPSQFPKSQIQNRGFA